MGGLPQVFEHVDEILHHGDLDLVAPGRRIDLARAKSSWPSVSTTQRMRCSGSRRSASAKPCSTTAPWSASTGAQVRLFSTFGRHASDPGSGAKMGSGVRG